MNGKRDVKKICNCYFTLCKKRNSNTATDVSIKSVTLKSFTKVDENCEIQSDIIVLLNLGSLRYSVQKDLLENKVEKTSILKS